MYSVREQDITYVQGDLFIDLYLFSIFLLVHNSKYVYTSVDTYSGIMHVKGIDTCMYIGPTKAGKASTKYSLYMISNATHVYYKMKGRSSAWQGERLPCT